MDSLKNILEFKTVSKSFGGLQAISVCSFGIEQGEIFSLIGPNGAGKTTALNLITGIYTPDSGKIVFEGKEISGKRSFEVARAGISRTFQNLQVFNNMTVIENVMVGLHRKTRSGFFKSLFRTRNVRQEETYIRNKAEEIIEFFGLEEKAYRMAEGLSYGEQKRIELARAMALSPRLLLLDEPVAGLNPSETQDISRLILKIRKSGVTIVLVEHDMNLVMEISDRIAVLNYGEKIAEGTPEEIRNNPKVIEAYLGEEV